MLRELQKRLYPILGKIKEEQMKKQTKVCCSKIDVKNEGYVLVKNIKVWEYHCYTCDKTWTEKEDDNVKNISL